MYIQYGWNISMKLVYMYLDIVMKNLDIVRISTPIGQSLIITPNVPDLKYGCLVLYWISLGNHMEFMWNISTWFPGGTWEPYGIKHMTSTWISHRVEA